MKSLEGTTCFVTGAGAGLGQAMAYALAQAGATVIGADIDIEALDKSVVRASVLRPASMHSMPLDVSSPKACATAIAKTEKEFGKIDVLVNCAGLGPPFARGDKNDARPLLFWEVDHERAWRMLEVNLRGPFLLAQSAVPGMLERGWGRIVNVTTSFSTMIRGGNMSYGQTKCALEGATASWSADLENTGVTANVLIPGGAADTGMVPSTSNHPRSSLLPASVMGAPACYLASTDSDGVNGKRFVAQFFDQHNPLSSPGCSPAAWPELAAAALKNRAEGSSSHD
jgi:3-oxoacyl-[acyl-carrier protein] reductase